MPFKSLAGLKKLGTLDAEIVTLASYPSASVCAAFSSDPVKVAVFAFAGGQPKVQQVSLDTCDAGALIDERVAVVKSGDTLWGLIDIQHKPKIEPIGRSMRGLFNNAGSNGALALGWDGEGSELKLEGNEVVGRDFQLRGSIRTCSLDGVNCYVVADDGDGGGKFREHAGNTPEAGTQLRCDLPLAARRMTRLAGGPQLSALTERGALEVCVIRKVGAAALEAKMLGTQSPVVDVAVLESTLFVLSADGVLRVYGADALHRTGDGGQAVATYELALGAEGVPTALAATSRGGNRLWIGTRDGEVFRCDCVKGSISL